MYDSECDKFDLVQVFACDSKETKQQTNHLFAIPKIFLLDMGRTRVAK